MASGRDTQKSLFKSTTLFDVGPCKSAKKRDSPPYNVGQDVGHRNLDAKKGKRTVSP